MGVTSLIAFAAILAAAEDHGAHVHGVGHMGIGVDADGLMAVELEAPGDTVYGFEHAPRDASERQIVDDARTALLGEDNAVVFNAEAGCRYLGGEIEGAETPDHAHRDLHILYRFACTAPDRLERIGTRLFDRFEGFEEIEGVFVSPRRQEGFELTPSAPAHRLSR